MVDSKKQITGVKLGEAIRYPAGSGDTWTAAWAGDDCLYAVSDDTGGWHNNNKILSNLTISKITGNSYDSLDGLTINQMLEYGKAGELIPLPEGDGCCWKASGCACIDDVIYIGVSRHFYGTSQTGYHQLSRNANFAKSTDFGLTWTRSAKENYTSPMFPGPYFSNPYIIDYGKNGRVPDGFTQPDNSDNYIYAVSNDGAWNNGNSMRLGRVPRSKLWDLKGSDWEFYRGTDGNLDGILDSSWISDINKAGTILYNDDCISMNGATYIPALGQYIMVQWYYPYLKETIYSASIWDFYMAHYPWGPWKKVGSHNCSPYGYYNPTITSKFINNDGLNLLILTNGDFSYHMNAASLGKDELESSLYCFTVVPVTLETEMKDKEDFTEGVPDIESLIKIQVLN